MYMVSLTLVKSLDSHVWVLTHYTNGGNDNCTMVLFRNTHAPRQVNARHLLDVTCNRLNYWNIALAHNVGAAAGRSNTLIVRELRVRMQLLASPRPFVLLPGCDLA